MANAEWIVLSFPPDNAEQLDDQEYHTAALEHIANLNRCLKDPTSGILGSAGQLLQLLNPAVHSLSALALLNATKPATGSDSALVVDFANQVARFIETFDARQVRYGGRAFSSILQGVASCVWHDVTTSLELLAAAMLRLDPDSHMLTTTHCELASLAYQTGALSPVLPVIEKPYVFVPNMANQPSHEFLCSRTASPAEYITTENHLTGPLTRDEIMDYDYTCGRIFVRLRRWGDAHDAFGRVVSFANRDGGVLPLMLTSYKKWLLTGLLAHGQPRNLPQHTHPRALSKYKSLSKPYTELANVFPTDKVDDLRTAITSAESQWAEDENTILIGDVQRAYQKWQIIRLAEAYCKISVPEIRDLTTSAVTGQKLATDQEVEATLREMDDAGMLPGTLDTHEPSGRTCVTFHPRGEEEPLTEEAFAVRMKKGVETIKVLGKVAQSTDSRLTTSPDYVKFMTRDKGRRNDSSMPDAGFGFDQSVEDEDLMVDMGSQV